MWRLPHLLIVTVVTFIAATASASIRKVGTWGIIETPDRFADHAAVSAVLPSGPVALALACVSGVVSVGILKLDMPAEKKLGLIEVKMRVDDLPVRTAQAIYQSADVLWVVTGDEMVNDISAAKQRIDVRVAGARGDLTFAATGSSEAVAAVRGACKK